MTATELREQSIILEDFLIERSKRHKISPELRHEPRRLRDKAHAIEAYASRGFLCKIGLHRRRQAWYGGAIPGTCDKCHYNEVDPW